MHKLWKALKEIQSNGNLRNRGRKKWKKLRRGKKRYSLNTKESKL